MMIQLYFIFFVKHPPQTALYLDHDTPNPGSPLQIFYSLHMQNNHSPHSYVENKDFLCLTQCIDHC